MTFFNASAERITDIRKDHIQDQKPDDILPKDLCGIQKRLDQGETVTEQEVECTFTSHKTIPVSISATRIANDIGDVLGQVLILRDLREIRQLQHAVRQQEKSAAMGKLAAGVAHEVRNPLSSIKALATFFAGQFDKDSESHEAAQVMVQEVDRLNRVITELLELSKPTDLQRQPTDMGLLIDRSIQFIRKDASNQDVEIRVNRPEDIDLGWVDPDRLNQCLLNLYLNAIQAMANGGTLTVRRRPRR